MRLELFGMIRTSADAADPLMISKRFFQDIKTAGFFRRYRGSMNNLHGLDSRNKASHSQDFMRYNP